MSPKTNLYFFFCFQARVSELRRVTNRLITTATTRASIITATAGAGVTAHITTTPTFPAITTAVTQRLISSQPVELPSSLLLPELQKKPASSEPGLPRVWVAAQSQRVAAEPAGAELPVAAVSSVSHVAVSSPGAPGQVPGAAGACGAADEARGPSPALAE